MSNSEMVERVAKAIYETWAVSRGVTEPWDELRRLGHSIVEEARSEARAAIKAMREPTAEMLESCGNGECAKWAPGAWDGGGAVSEWKPIETAPKDGTRILAYTPDGIDGPLQAVVYWYVHHGERYSETDQPGLYRRENYAVDWWEGAGFTPFRATHWMPLPAPPVEAKSEDV